MRSYMPPIKIGETVRALGVGIIVNSHSTGYKVGTYVSGLLGWQEYCKIHVSQVEKIPAAVKPSLYLGIFGMTGLTAYVSVRLLGKAQKKQVVVISTAAGAVGSVAVQVAKAQGCKVIGITGSDEKVQWLKELGIYGVINYKTENVASALKTMCPEGVDMYLDNVGGEMLDAVLMNAKKGSRMILCGAIQSYGLKKAQPVYMYPLVISKSIKMKGFIINDYQDKYEEAIQYLSKLHKKGELTYKEDIVEGLENAYQALQKLATGGNQGKMLIRVLHEAPKL
jgi:NADPH-dependent curcumin reductase CurA